MILFLNQISDTCNHIPNGISNRINSFELGINEILIVSKIFVIFVTQIAIRCDGKIKTKIRFCLCLCMCWVLIMVLEQNLWQFQFYPWKQHSLHNIYTSKDDEYHNEYGIYSSSETFFCLQRDIYCDIMRLHKLPEITWWIYCHWDGKERYA